MNEKTLIGIGVVAVAAPVLAFWMFSGAHHSAETAAAAKPENLPTQTIATMQKGTTTSLLAAPPAASSMSPSGVQVTPRDQEKLAQMVGLTDSPNQPLNKEKWKKALPIAEKLVNQSADCEQRNWLNQFIAVGNMALEESPDYEKFALALATMYRDDRELQTGQPSN